MKVQKLFLLALLLAFSSSAFAQDTDRNHEVFAGYSYIRADTSDDNIEINLHGFNTAADWNWGWVGIAGEFGGTYTDTDTSLYTFMAGPRVQIPGWRLKPFAHVLFGGAYANADSVNLDNTAFAMAAGGGLDWKWSDRIGVRLVQADYLMTNLDPLILSRDDRQNNFRISTGLVFKF